MNTLCIWSSYECVRFFDLSKNPTLIVHEYMDRLTLIAFVYTVNNGEGLCMYLFVSAVVVRYLTGRYLSEYAHAPEMTYERTVDVDGISVPLKLTDISGKVKLLRHKRHTHFCNISPNAMNPLD